MSDASLLAPTSSAASSPGVARGAAPAPLNPILGRDDEIERTLRHLDRDDLRLLTLLGPGGVGKTRLALEVMRLAGGDFAHGARFVSLAPVREPVLVPFAVAQALGIQESGALAVTELLTAWLEPRHLLLVLDNMEQVIAAASPWLTDLLASCPRLTVLATSRIALNITGEQRYRVPPLPVPDPSATDRLDAYASIALFAQRAQAVQADFALDSGNMGTIADICTRLDGLPLAIELAAARLSVFSPVEILARLTDRLTLLTGHVRDAPPRLRSLRDAIGWSYDLLTPEERKFHARLAGFVGGFSLEAATHMAALSPVQPDTADRIAALIDQSLVERVDGASGTRFRMLETIREYGLAYLAEQGQLDAARDAHAAFYQQVAVQAEDGLKGPDQVRWLRRLDDEHGNLREAMSWLTARDRVPEAVELFSNITHFMHVRAHFTEWGQLLDGWFALPELGHRTRTRALALLADGLKTASLGEATPAIRSLGEALKLFRELADPKNVLFSLNALSFAYWTASDLDHARVANDECLPMATHLGDTRNQARALNVLANIVWHEGDPERARRLFEKALAVARRAGDQWVIGMALGALGRLALDTGEDMRAAARLLNEGRTIQEALGDRRNLPVEYD
nr:tetratricopeptide repeat protein [Chloroflexia bacterium]